MKDLFPVRGAASPFLPPPGFKQGHQVLLAGRRLPESGKLSG